VKKCPVCGNEVHAKSSAAIYDKPICRKRAFAQRRKKEKTQSAIHFIRKNYLALEYVPPKILFRLLTSLDFNFHDGKWSKLDKQNR
jgi:hypothetical protein